MPLETTTNDDTLLLPSKQLDKSIDQNGITNKEDDDEDNIAKRSRRLIRQWTKLDPVTRFHRISVRQKLNLVSSLKPSNCII